MARDCPQKTQRSLRSGQHRSATGVWRLLLGFPTRSRRLLGPTVTAATAAALAVVVMARRLIDGDRRQGTCHKLEWRQHRVNFARARRIDRLGRARSRRPAFDGQSCIHRDVGEREEHEKNSQLQTLQLQTVLNQGRRQAEEAGVEMTLLKPPVGVCEGKQTRTSAVTTEEDSPTGPGAAIPINPLSVQTPQP